MSIWKVIFVVVVYLVSVSNIASLAVRTLSRLGHNATRCIGQNAKSTKLILSKQEQISYVKKRRFFFCSMAQTKKRFSAPFLFSTMEDVSTT